MVSNTNVWNILQKCVSNLCTWGHWSIIQRDDIFMRRFTTQPALVCNKNSHHFEWMFRIMNETRKRGVTFFSMTQLLEHSLALPTEFKFLTKWYIASFSLCNLWWLAREASDNTKIWFWKKFFNVKNQLNHSEIIHFLIVLV